jgi:hypothetical protein
MTKVIHFYAEECKDRVAKAEASAKSLQVIHDDVISLGAVDLDIKELREIIDAESSHEGLLNVRKAILKDKKLEIAGLKIDPSMITLPEKQIASFVLEARKFNGGRHLKWHYYSVENGKVIVTESAKQEIEESFKVYGSVKAKKTIEDVEKLCKQINSIREQVGATDTYSPLRTPETWISWNAVEKKYEPDFLKLANCIKE